MCLPQAKRAKQTGSLAALKAELAAKTQPRQQPPPEAEVPIEQQRILTEEDFERIRCPLSCMLPEVCGFRGLASALWSCS